MSNKKGLLPIVSEEVTDVVELELEQKDIEYINEILNRMKEDNPVIYDVIQTSVSYLQTNYDYSEEELLPALYLSTIVYCLLESQAEANKLNKEVFGD